MTTTTTTRTRTITPPRCSVEDEYLRVMWSQRLWAIPPSTQRLLWVLIMTQTGPATTAFLSRGKRKKEE